MILIFARHVGLASGVGRGLEEAGREVLVLTDVDVTSMRAVRSVVEQRRPQAVLHMAFADDPVHCESNPDEAFLNNAESVINLVAATLEFNAVPMIWSPAQVLAGAGHRAEDDEPQPTSVWTESRIRGEVFLRRATPKGLVFRSGPLVSMDLRLEAERLRQGITVGSARVQPVLAPWLGRVVHAALAAEIAGIVHVPSAGRVQPEHEFWTEVARHLEIETPRVFVDPLGGAGNAVLRSDRKGDLELSDAPPEWSTVLATKAPAEDRPTEALAAEAAAKAGDGPTAVTTSPAVWSWSLAPGAPQRWKTPQSVVMMVTLGKAFVEAGDDDRTLKVDQRLELPGQVDVRVTVPETTVLVVVGRPDSGA